MTRDVKICAMHALREVRLTHGVMAATVNAIIERVLGPHLG